LNISLKFKDPIHEGLYFNNPLCSEGLTLTTSSIAQSYVQIDLTVYKHLNQQPKISTNRSYKNIL
jgi:hypothetical protein